MNENYKKMPVSSRNEHLSLRSKLCPAVIQAIKFLTWWWVSNNLYLMWVDCTFFTCVFAHEHSVITCLMTWLVFISSDLYRLISCVEIKCIYLHSTFFSVDLDVSIDFMYRILMRNLEMSSKPDRFYCRITLWKNWT